MKVPVWVRHDAVVVIHEQLLAEFGGSAGVRETGLLESALARPQHLFAYAKPTTFELAASYAYGLVKNHPFVDGNKRTGFTMAVLFLELNGYRFGASEADAIVQTLALTASGISEADYAAWLEANSQRTHTRGVRDRR